MRRKARITFKACSSRSSFASKAIVKISKGRMLKMSRPNQDFR